MGARSWQNTLPIFILDNYYFYILYILLFPAIFDFSTKENAMSQQQTLAFLKPANFITWEMIRQRLVNAGFRISRIAAETLSREQLREHYAEHVERPFFAPMVDYLTSGPVQLLILERDDGKDPVQTLRDLVGPTDPKKGQPGQIRHDFGVKDDDVIWANGIHASGSVQEAKAEIARFF